MREATDREAAPRGTAAVGDYDRDQVRALRNEPIAPEEKGFGGPRHRTPHAAAGLIGTSVDDGWLSSPRALLSSDALRHNVETMASYCRHHDITVLPHAKTTMAPQLVAMQLDAGAPGITVATAAQARLFRRFGVRRILIANEVVDAASVAWLAAVAADDREFSISCYVDSLAGVDMLQDALGRHGADARLSVLVELGHAAGRTGVRSAEEALAVASAVAGSTRLSLAGVAGYEGSIAAAGVEEAYRAAVGYCEHLASVVTQLSDAGLFDDVPVVTAGGSAYFDAVVAVLAGNPSWRVVLRSGCYVNHDHGLYASVSPFGRIPGSPGLVSALEVRAPVLSRPEPGVAVVGAGRRDVSFDSGPPLLLNALRGTTALSVEGAVGVRLFDQHFVVSVPDECELAPGDEVGLGISHPCTTFDKWRWLPLVDADGVIVDVVRTFF
jgi:D-serine deaminase-like pyridoxal phosphate-dependent protein